jgi:D-alanyl-D-alanine carboxypeptidase
MGPDKEMRRKKWLCLLGCLIMVLTPAVLEAASIWIKAKSAILMDMNSGRVLFAKKPDRPMPPASLTKILSLYLVHEAVKDMKVRPQDRVKVSENASLTRGSRMRLSPGSDVALEELIKGMAIVSGNDASVAVAEHVGGDVETFVVKMNEKAQTLGMTHSRFQNPNGLPAKNQVTTARDILTLSQAYLRDFPDSMKIHSMRSFTFEGNTLRNKNNLLSNSPDVDGLKTGFVGRGGYHIVATAKRGDTRLIAVVMGCRNYRTRTREAMKLLTAGFEMTDQKAVSSGEGGMKEEGGEDEAP